MRIIRVPHSGFNALTVTEFESSSTCDERIVCLNSQEVTVIRKALEPLYWPTRYGEFISPNYFQIAPNGALLAVLREIDYKMGCNDLSSSIEALAGSLERGLLAIANRPCCDDNTQIIINANGGVTGTTPSGQITYGTQEPIAPPSTYPDGYESQEQYETQKCAIANGIVTGVVFSLDALTAISGVNAIAATVGVILAAVPLIPVSPVLIPVLVPLVATAWLASGVLHAASLMVEENRSTLVCILVSGENISVIFEQLSDAIDVMIASMSWSGPVALAVKSLIMVLLNGDTLNQLYGVFAGFMYPEADCSDCEDEESYDCGDEGEPQYSPIFCVPGDGNFSLEDNILTINATDSSSSGTYRFAVEFGSTWNSPPYASRWLKRVISINNLGGDVNSGYLQLIKVDNSSITIDGDASFAGHNLAALNDELETYPHCVAYFIIAYGTVPCSVVCELGEPVEE